MGFKNEIDSEEDSLDFKNEDEGEIEKKSEIENSSIFTLNSKAVGGNQTKHNTSDSESEKNESDKENDDHPELVSEESMKSTKETVADESSDSSSDELENIKQFIAIKTGKSNKMNIKNKKEFKKVRRKNDGWEVSEIDSQDEKKEAEETSDLGENSKRQKKRKLSQDSIVESENDINTNRKTHQMDTEESSGSDAKVKKFKLAKKARKSSTEDNEQMGDNSDSDARKKKEEQMKIRKRKENLLDYFKIRKESPSSEDDASNTEKNISKSIKLEDQQSDDSSSEEEAVRYEFSKRKNSNSSESEHSLKNNSGNGNEDSNTEDSNCELELEDQIVENTKQDRNSSGDKNSTSTSESEECDEKLNGNGDISETEMDLVNKSTEKQNIKSNQKKVMKENLKENSSSSSEEEEDEPAPYDSESDDKGSLDLSSRLVYKPTPEETKKLVNMLITLKHSVPIQHTIESGAGTRTINPAKRKEFELYAPLKTGSFTSDEDKIIKRNWRIFCKDHNWSVTNPKPFLQMRHKNKVSYMSPANRKKFVQFIADGLPSRSLYSVYNRFKTIYDPHKVHRYNEQEDNTILNYVSEYKLNGRDRKFADLARLLKRTRASVWRRYNKLLKKKRQKQFFENTID